MTLEELLENFTLKEKIKGGLADNIPPKHFDFVQLLDGIIVEFEHTSDVVVAMEIAMDHLVESPDYYKELKKMEAEL